MSAAYFIRKFLEKRRRKKKFKVQYNETDVPCYDNDMTNTNTKCRVCMKEASIPIYNKKSSFDVSEAIRTFGGVNLCENDDFSQHICLMCYTFLQNAVLFRQSAQNTEKMQRQTTIHDYDSVDVPSDIPLDDNNHCRYQTFIKSYVCKLCKMSFEYHDELVAHKNSKAHKSVRVQCPVCFRLLTAQLFKRHLERHQSASHLICDICGKLYRKDNLIRHLQLHNFELPYQCQVCPYRGRFMESLKIHIRTHTGDKPFSCDKCELRFLTRSNLNRHLLTHKKEKPFKCVECGRGFYTKRDLESHFKADHVGLKDFNCKMCGNKYGTRKALMRHELRVHKRNKMAKGRMPLYLQAEYQKRDEG